LITSSIVLPVCLATSSNILFSPNDGVVIDPLAFLDFAVLNYNPILRFFIII
jgi:hypothetical protein